MVVIRDKHNFDYKTEFNSEQLQANSLPMQLVFALDDGQVIHVPGYDRITIGRNLRENHKTVDLTNFDNTGYSIARRHVEILPVRGRLTVQDLYSVQGTWLNGVQLEAGCRYPLCNGDRLMLGDITIIVWFNGLTHLH